MSHEYCIDMALDPAICDVVAETTVVASRANNVATTMQGNEFAVLN